MKAKTVNENMQMPFRNDKNKSISQKYPLENPNYLGDSVEGPEDTEEIEPEENLPIEDEDILKIDVSDMVDAEDIEVEDDEFNNQTISRLNNEIKLPEFNRNPIKFKIRGTREHILGIPMAKMSNNAYLFKLEGNKMKKFYLKDIILENENKKLKKVVKESLEEEFENDTYTLNDGRKIIMEEDNIRGMAGEPMTVHYFIDKETGQKLSFHEIEDLLNEKDYDEINAILYRDAENNESAAINWVR